MKRICDDIREGRLLVADGAWGTRLQEAGLQPDDLILFLNDQVLNSSKQFRSELEYIDRIDEVRLLVQRGQELLDVSLFVE